MATAFNMLLLKNKFCYIFKLGFQKIKNDNVPLQDYVSSIGDYMFIKIRNSGFCVSQVVILYKVLYND